MHEAEKRKTKRGKEVRRLPGGAHSQYLPQDQAQIEGRGVNQRPFGDILLAAQMHAPHAPGIVEVGSGSFQMLSPPA